MPRRQGSLATFANQLSDSSAFMELRWTPLRPVFQARSACGQRRNRGELLGETRPLLVASGARSNGATPASLLARMIGATARRGCSAGGSVSGRETASAFAARLDAGSLRAGCEQPSPSSPFDSGRSTYVRSRGRSRCSRFSPTLVNRSAQRFDEPSCASREVFASHHRSPCVCATAHCASSCTQSRSRACRCSAAAHGGSRVASFGPIWKTLAQR